MLRHTRLLLTLVLLLGPGGAASQVVQTAARGAQEPSDPGILLERPARLDVRDVPLLTALARLEDSSDLALAYSPTLVPHIAVTCLCADSTVAAALRTILAGTGFTFRASTRQVILLPEATPDASGRTARGRPIPPAPAGTATAAQPAIITGRITTEGGTPLAGAVATVLSVQRSALSDATGAYRIVVPESQVVERPDTLVVSTLGYGEERVPFTLRPGEIRLDVPLAVDAIELGEIVVTGTAGNRQRGAQPAVISRIDATDVIDHAPVADVTEVLEGRVPGIAVTDGSGTTGAASRINIRGAASISLSNEPLVFIDGVRVDSRQRELVDVGGQTLSALSDLNPADIERIEVVKGPAAATLYGADASAGVIQIITKRGRAGVHELTQTVSFEYGAVRPNFTPYTNYAQCPEAFTDPAADHPLCAGLAAGAIVSDNPLVRERAFQDGHATSLRYSARGGGDGYGYYASFAADDEDGTTRNNTLERRTGRINFNWVASPELTFDATIGLGRNEIRLPPGDQSSYGYMIGAGLGSPLTVRHGEDGELAGGWLMGSTSVESISSIVSDVSTLRATPSAKVEYTPTSWLTNRLTLGGDVTKSTALQFYPKNDESWYSGDQANGWVQSVRSTTTIYTVDYLGNVQATFGDDDRFSSDLSFGVQYIDRLTRALAATGIGLTTNTSNLISSAATNAANEAYSAEKSLGLFLQEQVGYRDRLFVQLGARVDRNSAFGTDAGAFFLPKVGFSYILSEEPFWEPASGLVSTLRLRGAYGTTGRSPTPGAALETYQSVPYVTDAGTLEPGLIPLNPGNDELRPERGTELELGFDAGLLDDRAGLELTFFEKRTTDLLIQVPQPPSSGFTQGGASRPYDNIGEVLNRGFEFAVRATPLSRSGIHWELGVHGSTLHNELVSLGDLDPFVNSYRVFAPGRELGSWYVNRIREVDVENGLVIVSDTAEYLDGQMPDFESSLTSTLTLFDRLRLFARFEGKLGYRIYNLGHEYRDRFFQNSADVVLPPEEGGYSEEERLRRFGPYVGENSGQPIPFTEVKEDYIQPGDHLRFAELSATVLVPDRLVDALGVRNASVTFGGRNLGLWSEFSGYDPEVLGTGPGSAGSQFYDQFYIAEVFTTPPARRWIARVQFQF